MGIADVKGGWQQQTTGAAVSAGCQLGHLDHVAELGGRGQLALADGAGVNVEDRDEAILDRLAGEALTAQHGNALGPSHEQGQFSDSPALPTASAASRT